MGNAGPGGAIPGARVGGCANASACTGIATPRGTIPGAEVGGGTNALHCTACGVVAVVIAPRVGCCRHFCTTCGVGVGVLAPRAGCRCHLCAVCGVAVVVVGPRGRRHRRLCTVCVSQSWSSCHVVLRSWWLSSCRVVPQLRSSSSHHHWTTKEEVSRKKKKENVQAGRRGACSREGHGDAMPSRSVVGPGRPSRERATTRRVPSLALWPPQFATISQN